MKLHSTHRDAMSDSMGPTLDENTIAALRELADEDDPDFLNDLIGTYLHDTSQSLENLGLLLSEDAPERADMRRVAHTLKGASQNIGAVHMAACCFDLERSAETADLARLREIYSTMTEAFASARESLGREMAEAS